MKKLTTKDIEILEREVPGFIKSVEIAKQKHVDYLFLNILGFAAESEARLLQMCLFYAYERGVAVLFSPDQQGPPEKN